MKKIVLLIILLFLVCSLNLFSVSVTPDYKPKGLLFSSSLTYENVFDSDYKYFTLNILELSVLPASDVFTLRLNLLTQFSPDINIFDFYYGMGFAVYPFKKYLSISGNFNWNFLFFLLNHFSYTSDIKMNVDIPIYKSHNVTFGVGLRHRNALRIINWLDLKDEYYDIYNSYFFEIGYRMILP